MNILKKSLTLLLAMCIMIAPVSSFASQASSDYSELIASLTDLGIIDDTVSFRKSQTASVTREDLAVIIANIIDIAYFQPVCADVMENSVNYGKINAVVNLGIMSNDSEGKFNPAAQITYKEAANAFAKALCLEVLYEGRKTDTFIASIENKLIVGAKFQDKATSEKFVDMLYSALEMGTISLEGVNDEYGFDVLLKSGQTLLSRYRNIYSVSGVVLANGRTSVDSTDSVGDGKVKIGTTVFSAGNTDIANAIGYNVYAYIDRDAGDKILAYYKEKNNVLEIDGQDLRNSENYIIRYRGDNGKTREIKLDRYVGSLYNGVYGGALTADRLNVPDGKITLIDFNRDNKWDVVSILDYQDYVVNGIDVSNKLIYDELGKDPISYDPTEDDVTIILTDRILTIEEFETVIETGDVLTVATSTNLTGKKSVVIEVSFDKIDGVFRQVNEGKREITISDIKYETTAAFLASGLTDSLTAKSQVRVYLNAFDKVCYITGVELDNMTEKQGYLMQVALVGTLSGNMEMRVFGMDGVATIYSTGSTVKVNYQKMTASEAYDFLTAVQVPYDSDEDGILDTTRFNDQLIIYSVDENGLVSSIRTAEEIPNPNSFSKDVVMDSGYTQTYMNNIIYTTAINSAYSTFYPNCGDGAGQVSYEFSLGKTVLYISGRDNTGLIEEKKIKWQTGLSDGKSFGNVAMYDIDDANVASVTVVESESVVSANYDGEDACRFTIVEDMRVASDDEGDYIELIVWRNAKQETLKIREISMTQYPFGEDEDHTTYNDMEHRDDIIPSVYDSESGATSLSEIFNLIQEGDVLQVVLKEDEITSFRKIFTLGARASSQAGLITDTKGDKKVIYAPEGPVERVIEYTSGTADKTEAGNLEIYGTVAGVSDGVLAINTKDRSGTEFKRVRKIDNAYNLIYVMEVQDDGSVSVKVGSLKNDVRGGVAGSEILLHSRVGFARESLIIVRN